MVRPAVTKTIAPGAGDKMSPEGSLAGPCWSVPGPCLSLCAGNYPCWVRDKTQANSAVAETGPGDGLVKAGGIVFIVGAIATLVTMAPLFLHTDPFPTISYAVCMLMGVGFVIAAAGVLRGVAAQRRQARSAT